jgi:hypothetical protein
LLSTHQNNLKILKKYFLKYKINEKYHSGLVSFKLRQAQKVLVLESCCSHVGSLTPTLFNDKKYACLPWLTVEIMRAFRCDNTPRVISFNNKCLEFEFQWALVKGLVFRCKFNKFLLVKNNKYIYKFLKFIFKKIIIIN